MSSFILPTFSDSLNQVRPPPAAAQKSSSDIGLSKPCVLEEILRVPRPAVISDGNQFVIVDLHNGLIDLLLDGSSVHIGVGIVIRLDVFFLQASQGIIQANAADDPLESFVLQRHDLFIPVRLFHYSIPFATFSASLIIAAAV